MANVFDIRECIREKERERESEGDKEELVNMTRPNKTCENFH